MLSQLPAFSLVGVDGKAFSSEQLQGQVYIASFFFTSCRSICPAIMQGMGRLQKGFEEREIQGIRLVSITVDPEHDTPEVLREYAKSVGALPARWN